jgi:hypothetical protein
MACSTCACRNHRRRSRRRSRSRSPDAVGDIRHERHCRDPGRGTRRCPLRCSMSMTIRHHFSIEGAVRADLEQYARRSPSFAQCGELGGACCTYRCVLPQVLRVGAVSADSAPRRVRPRARFEADVREFSPVFSRRAVWPRSCFVGAS